MDTSRVGCPGVGSFVGPVRLSMFNVQSGDT